MGGTCDNVEEPFKGFCESDRQELHKAMKLFEEAGCGFQQNKTHEHFIIRLRHLLQIADSLDNSYIEKVLPLLEAVLCLILETRPADIRLAILSVLDTLLLDHNPEPQPDDTSKRRGVTWKTGDAEAEIKTYDNHRASVLPVHGHWVPPELKELRHSFQGEAARALGGRHVRLHTACRLKTVNCIFVEPMGKLLSPEQYLSTGLVICIHPFRNTRQVVEEWAQVLKRTKLLDAGISMVLLDLCTVHECQSDSEETNQDGEIDTCPHTERGLDSLHANDILECVRSSMSLVGTDKCVLFGKGFGANLCVEAAVAASQDLDSRPDSVSGVVLFAPTAAPPSSCSSLSVPALLVWAQDDKVASFQGAPAWAEALDSRTSDAGAAFRDPEIGGNDLARVFRKDDKTAADTLYFVVSSLLLSEMTSLSKLSDPKQIMLPDDVLRLIEELPQAWAQHLDWSSPPRLSESLSDLATHYCAEFGLQKTCLDFRQALHSWIRQDMLGAASAKE